jgi:hypothetical protein
MAFLREIVCLHFNPAAKVELGMLKKNGTRTCEMWTLMGNTGKV